MSHIKFILSEIINDKLVRDDNTMHMIDEIKEFHSMLLDGLICQEEFDNMIFCHGIRNDL